MSLDQSAFPKDLLSPLGNSGFPFQTAVAAAIRSVAPFTVEEEVAWQDGDGSHRFLDMVASSAQVRICIECKAMRNDKLVFLLPQNASRQQTADVQGVHLGRVQDSTRRPVVGWTVSQTMPLTPESIYCVALGKPAGESRLIEREAQPLVRGTEEYAKDRCREFRPGEQQPQSVMCIPVLFTIASLFVAEYDPLGISLKDGIYQAREEHIRPAHFVRFTKEFTAYGSERTRLRTVIVAQATHLEELVHGLGSARVGAHAESWVTIYDSLGGQAQGRQR